MTQWKNYPYNCVPIDTKIHSKYTTVYWYYWRESDVKFGLNSPLLIVCRSQ